MKEASDGLGAGEWVVAVLYAVLLVVVLLAPFVPFALLYFVARTRPDLWAAYWSHPWRNALVLALALAAARVFFLALLYALPRLPGVGYVATYIAAYGWYPEFLATLYLSDLGWDVSPSPETSWFRHYGIIFALNLSFWLGFLGLAALGKTTSRH